jgi:Domain of unknown function (DUF3395)
MSPAFGQTTAPAAGQLVITRAVYGDLPDGPKTDVTEKVKAMVKDNRLTVEASNENFGDPASGVNKSLEVDYTIDNVSYIKTADEDQTLAIK